MNFIYLKSLFITWMVYLNPTYWPAPSWLVSSVGRALHRYRKRHGFKSRTGLNFYLIFLFFIFRSYFQLLVSAVFLAARISYIRFFTALQIYEFHISKIIIDLWCVLRMQMTRPSLNFINNVSRNSWYWNTSLIHKPKYEFAQLLH